MENDQKMPIKRFSTGAICATIWNNTTTRDGRAVEFNTISFERRYKDKDGKWKSSNSLRQGDLPKALVVLRRAYEHLVLKDLQPA